MSDLFQQDAVKMETDVAVVPDTNPMIMAAIDGKLDAESIKMLIELSNKQEDRRSKQLFDENFAILRAKLGPIIKTKLNGAFGSKYAPIEDLQEPCDPVIFECGFSYSWREESLQNGKRVWLDINGYGYTKSNYFDTPNFETNKAQNALQAQGIMSTYGQRYTFKSGFGIVTKGEDTDGNTFDIGNVLNYATELKAINDAKDFAELNTAFQAAYKLAGDNDGRKIITSAKDARKKELAK